MVHWHPGRESHIFVNFALPEDQNRTNRPARPCCNVMLLGFCDSYAYQVRAACGRRIGICGYTSVPKDERTCLFAPLGLGYIDYANARAIDTVSHAKLFHKLTAYGITGTC